MRGQQRHRSRDATLRVDAALLSRVEGSLAKAAIAHTGALMDANSMRFRFADTDTQLKAKDAIDKALNADPANPSYVVALNLLSASPRWLTAIGALPMYLGLDLRGGVHFLLQVDMQAALQKRLEAFSGELRGLLRESARSRKPDSGRREHQGDTTRPELWAHGA